MPRGGWKVAVAMVALPVAMAVVAGCSGGGGHPAATRSASAAKAAVAEGITPAMLKNALLTRVNGVAAAAPVSSGKYAAVAQASNGKRAAGSVQVTPKSCTVAATQGFDPTVLAGAPAAAVTFEVASNGVAEVLVASSAKSAATALAGQIPKECASYKEKVGGKTMTYGITEQAVTGVGKQAKALNVRAVGGAASDNMWSLIYRGTGFVGTVTVTGPNASEKAVQELGQQAYAFAAKTLA
jgi:hypothetical protein